MTNKNWINDVVEQAQREVRAWPQWMQRPELREQPSSVKTATAPESQTCGRARGLPPSHLSRCLDNADEAAGTAGEDFAKLYLSKEGAELVDARGSLWQLIQETMKRAEATGMDPDDVARVVREAADDLQRRRAEMGR